MFMCLLLKDAATPKSQDNSVTKRKVQQPVWEEIALRERWRVCWQYNYLKGLSSALLQSGKSYQGFHFARGSPTKVPQVRHPLGLDRHHQANALSHPGAQVCRIFDTIS